jgi:hypothetical protein
MAGSRKPTPEALLDDLHHLHKQLWRFLDDEPGSLRPKRGWIPIVKGHYVYEAVRRLERHFDRNRLPRPALHHWQRLLAASRRKEIVDVGPALVDLLDWVKTSIDQREDTPSDLITITTIESEFHTSRSSVMRDYKAGKLKSYRKSTRGRHVLSRREVATLYPQRPKS